MFPGFPALPGGANQVSGKEGQNEGDRREGNERESNQPDARLVVTWWHAALDAGDAQAGLDVRLRGRPRDLPASKDRQKKPKKQNREAEDEQQEIRGNHPM